MERAPVPVSAPPPAPFHDGLGERRQMADPTGNGTIEMLRVQGELAAVPSFEFALRERVSRLATFRHACFGRVRSVERLNDHDATLAVVSERVAGIRLSALLTTAEEQESPLDIDSALCLIRQLTPAVAALHEHARDAAHGALGPERIVVTPQAVPVIVEYVMGSALEQLRFSHERYWIELGVPLPRSAGLPRFDQRADVMQIGMVALALVLGRVLRSEEFPSRIADVLASTWAVSARGGFEPLPAGLRVWLGRALQLDARNGFATVAEAGAELDKLPGAGHAAASRASLEAILSKLQPIEPPPAVHSVNPVHPVNLVHPVNPVNPVKVVASAPIPVEVPKPVQPVQPVQIVQPPRFVPAPVAAEAPARQVELTTPVRSPRLSLRFAVIGGAIAAIVAVIAGGTLAARRYAQSTAVATTGTLVVTTNPSGVQALVDGQLKGLTPLTLTLPAGAHVVELRGGREPRSIPVTITAGTESAQYIELPRSGATSGQLRVRTEPSGAEVRVDGIPYGTSPALIPDLLPGEHSVEVSSDLGSVRHSVTIEPGVTASLVVPLSSVPEGTPVSGWISMSTPIDIQLFENDRLLGTSQSDRIMVAAGRHDLDLVNDALGYRATRTVQVAAGRVAPLKIDVPNGVMALNALPWAEVWIDGERVGETPIGNLAVPLGSHDVVFRNPDLGEQRHTALVTLKEPTRLSVDLRKK